MAGFQQQPYSQFNCDVQRQPFQSRKPPETRGLLFKRAVPRDISMQFLDRETSEGIKKELSTSNCEVVFVAYS